MKRIKLFIADDHALMRVGLASMIGIEPDMEIVGEAANGQDAVRAVRSLRPDVVIMDLMMPKLNGADATREILQSLPDTRIIILSSFGSSAELRQAVANGAVGMQPKEDPTENLIRMIRAVHAGQTVFPPDVRKLLATAPQDVLTDKQAEIMRLVVQGLPTKQIAETVSISESGVKKHLQLIYAKIGASSRSEAVAIALRKHLLKI